jgi:hypothetical protein
MKLILYEYYAISVHGKMLLRLKQSYKLLILILSLYSLASCRPIQQYSQDINLQSWKYADVRLLDPIDVNEPAQDLIAVYSRINDRSVQIRADFLKMPNADDQDFYILFDTNPGGSPNVITDSGQDFIVDINWDYLIRIPGTGNVSIYDDHYRLINGMALLIMREPTFESLMLSFNKNTLPITIGRTFLQIIESSPKNNRILDKTDRFSIDTPSPSVGKVLFAFWNTFSSATPAQALRSWAGAHAGPVSSRHGLKYLLEAAYQSQIPILLPDLFTPDNLSALDYMGALMEVNKLINMGVIYPLDNEEINNNNKVFSDIKDKKLIINDIYNDFGSNDYAKFTNNNKCFQIPLGNSPINQSEDYLLSCKELLLTNAMNRPSLPMIIGGDFSESLLGDPNIIREIFGYVAKHPWIQVGSMVNMTAELYSLEKTAAESVNNIQNSGDSSVEFTQSFVISAEIEKSLNELPENDITNLAMQIFQSLTQPASEKLQNLRSNYIGQIGYLIKASDWSNKPFDMATCENDLDYDGQNECLLANSNIFAVIEPDGGYIPFVFTKDAQGVHQIIGPTWEFMVGISDISEWDNSKGLHSDPGQILGAFADNIREWNNYSYYIIGNEIVLNSSKMSMRKSISISPESLYVDIHSDLLNGSYTYIPLVVDPWVRYYPGWGDLYYGRSTNSFEWGIISGQMVHINTSAEAHFYAFNDTRSTMLHDEDPNFDYTRGHYLPFPMSLIEITATADFSVDLNLKP